MSLQGTNEVYLEVYNKGQPLCMEVTKEIELDAVTIHQPLWAPYGRLQAQRSIAGPNLADIMDLTIQHER